MGRRTLEMHMRIAHTGNAHAYRAPAHEKRVVPGAAPAETTSASGASA